MVADLQLIRFFFPDTLESNLREQFLCGTSMKYGNPRCIVVDAAADDVMAYIDEMMPL